MARARPLASRLRAKLRSSAAASTRPGPAPADAPPGTRCLVCATDRVDRRHLVFRGNEKLVKDATVCLGCGYVGIDELVADRYRGKTSLDQLPTVGRRAGTLEQAGREFHMAQLGMAILGGRRPHDVLVYGAGRSMDNHHIAALDSTGHVAIGDIMNARADMEFHDANRPATRTFDVVVASEVIEHFRNPTTDFPKLMQFVGEDGVLVCGTTLRSARPLVQQRYAFYPDHTSLYTPRSLQLIARGIDAQVDFRPVQGAGNKRYVIFTRTAEKMERVIAHFGNHPFGPSEKTAG